MLTHHGQSTELQPNDEIVLHRHRETPLVAFYREGVRLCCASHADRPSTSIDVGFLSLETLDPGSTACRSFSKFLEMALGKSLQQLPTEAAKDRYQRVLDHPCVAWRVR